MTWDIWLFLEIDRVTGAFYEIDRMTFPFLIVDIRHGDPTPKRLSIGGGGLSWILPHPPPPLNPVLHACTNAHTRTCTHMYTCMHTHIRGWLTFAKFASAPSELFFPSKFEQIPPTNPLLHIRGDLNSGCM